ncbi:MAG: NADH-quinone oxidoreductase subunit J [Bacteroidetes bacterium]|nr:NADH-quinone oxidoreductase subunit J [Bacteroidota bacterium]
MSVSDFFFYLFSAMIIVFGILAVTTKKIFHAAVYLLFTLINVAALYFYLNYEFLAAVQIVVYVGGIVVLILFSLFLTHRISDDMLTPPWYRMLLASLLCLFGFGFSFFLMLAHRFPDISNAPVEMSVHYIGKQMLNYGNGGFVLPFEVVSILLLAALIGSIAIAFKTKAGK